MKAQFKGLVIIDRRLFQPAPDTPPTHPKPDFASMERELRHKGVTRQLLWLEYKELHPDGYGYSQFCNLYNIWRRQLSVVMRQDHKAGEKLFVDFPGLTIPIYDDKTLELSFHAQLFVAVLGASNYLYAEALRDQGLEHWVMAHVHAFEFTALRGFPRRRAPSAILAALANPSFGQHLTDVWRRDFRPSAESKMSNVFKADCII